ncbi:hypothetical protein V495_00261 [Pseudogymnoascus sp. VKM F-4514 (FW-929)]|nr:hypothetical protein V490_03597 [Pseudogymnoascus sp. VKM F-3557]KFY50461.1 hypothetical protein V495_00261 [Pseudogymnoascus sp. VKM F-4514 (FW-929)]KFY67125.1 hypothetical protein V497_00554 [Pseudogymnoascus sp. VKM F-4516 (FW-969)]
MRCWCPGTKAGFRRQPIEVRGSQDSSGVLAQGTATTKRRERGRISVVIINCSRSAEGTPETSGKSGQ